MSWPSGDPRRETRAARLRQAAASGGAPINGIVAVELRDAGAPLRLECELVFAPPPGSLRAGDVSISGGVRRPRVSVTGISVAGRTLTIELAQRGDFSLYELSLRRDEALLPGFDALLSDIPVGFRLACQQGFDCQGERPADEAPPELAAIDYQARDYEGFRRLMLDRFAQLRPGFRDPGPASPEVTLVEMLAHVADRIAYAQDAVATEAYLDTARRRVSAKRHARLVDYPMHDGSNARAFVHVALRSPPPGAPPLTARASRGTRFMTRAAGVAVASGESAEVNAARASGAEIFEALEEARLSSAHNRILIHDWLEGVTELGPGTTRLSVVDEGRTLSLEAGDLLLLEEVLDADGNASPDPARRHVVRLRSVVAAVDPVGKLVGGDPQPLEILELTWSAADALPAALPLLRRPSTDVVDGIPPSPSQPTLIARGNIILVDHGAWRGQETLHPVRQPGRRRIVMPLSEGPVTLAAPNVAGSSAAEALAPLGRATAQLVVTRATGAGSPAVWTIVPELFGQGERQLALDIGDGGRATLRTDALGDATSFDTSLPFQVRYRLGCGERGNVGAEAIAHLLTEPYPGPDGVLVLGLTARPGDVARVRNPLPAVGGREPETIEEVRRRAPIAFRDPERAVTPDDYARELLEDPIVSGVRAVEQWTGSARAVVLLVDLAGGGTLDPALEARFRARLERVRLAGHVLEFRNPTLVPVEVALRVCVRPRVPRDAVLRRLARLFSSGRLPDGTPGLFHPDSLTFGSPLRLSRLYAAAHAVDGVAHVVITTLRRQGSPAAADALETGSLEFGPYEIPVLDNDPDFPDRGVVRFSMDGGA